MTADRVLEGFLWRQFEDGMRLAAHSERLELFPIPTASPPCRYLARFHCSGVLCESGPPAVVEARFDLGIWFPADYLRRAHPAQVLEWLAPRSVWHPNIGPVPRSAQARIFICVGRLAPGTSLVDLLYQCFEIITFNKVTMREDDALNQQACRWSRANRRRFPVDARPLRRIDFRVDATGGVER